MEPEQVLELIPSAPRRYETLRAALRNRGDTLGVMKGMYSNLGIEIDEAQLIRAVKRHAWEHMPEGMKGVGKKFRKGSPRPS
jgi:hypothetical protein